MWKTYITLALRTEKISSFKTKTKLMKKILLFTTLSIFLISLGQAQCGWTDISNQGTLPAIPCGSFGQVSNIGSGTYTYWNSCQGDNYTFSTCGSSFDTQLTWYWYNGSSWVSQQYNDDNGPDCSGAQASITWTNPNPSTVNNLIVLNRFNCQQHDFTGVSAVLQYRNNGPDAPPTPSGGGTYCASTTLNRGGAPAYATVSYYWQTSSSGTSMSNLGASQLVTSSDTWYQRSYNTCSGCWGGASAGVSVTINADPGSISVSGAGTFCASTTISASGGSGGTIYFQGTTSNGTSTATASTSQSITSSGTYYFRALTGAGCWGTQGSVAVNIDAPPAAANNTTANAVICGNGSTRGLTGTPGGGSFSLVSGPGSVSGTNYTSSGSGNAVIRYTTASSGVCPATTSDVTIQVDAFPTITSSPSSMCQGDTRTLTSDVVGTVFSGTGVSGTTFTAPNPGGLNGNYIITATNGSCSSIQVLTVYGIATITSSSADMCQDQTRALSSTGTSGYFIGTGVSGSTFTAPVPSGATQTYTITYVNPGSPCPSATQSITVFKTSTASNTTSNAPICEGTTKTLVSSGVGTGTWSIVGGSGSILGATYSTGNIGANETVTIRHTSINGPCPNATADVSFDVSAQPFPRNTTSPAAICESGTKALVGSWSGTSGAGTGTWSIQVGGGSIIGTTYTPANVSVNTTVTIRYEVVNGSCSDFVDRTFTVLAIPPTPGAGTDIVACLNSTVTMSGSSPAPFTGAWSWSPSAPTYVGGTSAADLNAQVTFATGGTHTGTWAISNNPCTASTDDVKVFVSSSATNATLVTGTSTIGTAACVEGLWTYYASVASPDDYIFAIAKNGNVFDADIEITDQAGTAPIVSTGGAGPDRGTFLINRYWNVSLRSGSVSSPVDIRFFVDPAEVTAAELAANQFLSTTAFATDVVGLTFFKTIGTPYSPSMMVGGDFTFTPQYLSHSTGTSNGITYYELTGLTSFSGGTGGFSVNDDGATLPVELLNFTAQVIHNEYVQLNWSTATEINNDGFVVMRSLDGLNFERIGWVAGNGNSTEINSYSFDDTEVLKGITYYYQLKQVDFNGEFEFFNIVSARLDGGRSFNIGSLIPNPSSANVNVNVDIFSITNEVITVSIYNHIGVLVTATDKKLVEGANNVKLEMDNLVSGTYFINFKGSFGTETRKLIIVN